MKNFLLPLFFALVCLGLPACKSAEKTPCVDPSRINEDAICIEIYKPVCGCDGKTYGNSCVADNAGVTSYKEGECK